MSTVLQKIIDNLQGQLNDLSVDIKREGVSELQKNRMIAAFNIIQLFIIEIEAELIEEETQIRKAWIDGHENADHNQIETYITNLKK